MVDLTQLHPELQQMTERLLAKCVRHPDLGGAGLTVVVTEGKRDNLMQARYFCQGRTVSEIAADLDHHEADQRQRAVMQQAIQEIYPPNETPEWRAPGRIVTNALPFTGPHCLGVAIHFGIKRGARMLYPDAPWGLVGRLAVSEVLFVWGGDWKSRDLAHLEMHKPWAESSTVAA